MLPERPEELRFIPARAGNTLLAHSSAWGSGGSSPLARGTLRYRAELQQRPRFIPARAGNTAARRAELTRPPVHPRSRGEHRTLDPCSGREDGSSPLARGTPDFQQATIAFRRFIPARAGNTDCAERLNREETVHPRSRGEHDEPGSASVRLAGSSPLARGTLVLEPEDLLLLRFIPARAGNTPRSAPPLWSRSVHPRSRGEHIATRTGLAFAPGSSPLARGTLGPIEVTLVSLRFIPARAGNTPRPPLSNPSFPVHPRSRGEHTGR